MRLDELRTYAHLASGLSEVARDSAVAATRTLLVSGASRLGLVSAADLEAASVQARSLEERVDKLEAQLREQQAQTAAPARTRPARARKATDAAQTSS